MPDTLPDLVQRLRDRAARKWTDEANRSASLFGQAADEIERLRAEVEALREYARSLMEPTPEMVAAGEAAFRSHCLRHINGAIPTYQAMIAARRK